MSSSEESVRFEISRSTYQPLAELYQFIAYSGPSPSPLVLSAVAPTATPPAPPVVPLPSTPPPASLPAPPAPSASPVPEPFRPTGAPASGGWSTETYRGQVERAARDTAKRKAAQRTGEKIIEGEILRRGAGAIGRAILGPLGGVIWGIVTPGKVGTGEVSPEELERNRARERARRQQEESILSEIGRDIFRGGAIGGAGIIIGGGVLIEEAARRWPGVPFPADPARDEPPVEVEVPRVEIPAPSIPQPSPLPLPSPVPTIPKPLPTPPTRTSSPPSTRTSSPPTTRTIPRSIPAPAPTSVPSPWPVIAQQLGSIVRNRRSAWTLPRSAAQVAPSEAIATIPATSVPPRFADPLTVPQSPTSPLTTFQPQVLGSAPPRLRTRTRQRECDCEPKRRKPKRECRASASVVWAGGPNKGKIAGRRCYSFVGGK